MSSESKIDEYGDLTMSEETIGSSVYWRIPAKPPVSARERNASLISSTVVSRAASTVRSTTEPVGTGARTAKPCSLPLSSGITRPIGLRRAGRGRDEVDRRRAGAPQVLVRRVLQALVGRVGVDRRHQPVLDADVSCSTLATGARQLVVHDALEMTWWLSAS